MMNTTAAAHSHHGNPVSRPLTPCRHLLAPPVPTATRASPASLFPQASKCCFTTTPTSRNVTTFPRSRPPLATNPRFNPAVRRERMTCRAMEEAHAQKGDDDAKSQDSQHSVDGQSPVLGGSPAQTDDPASQRTVVQSNDTNTSSTVEMSNSADKDDGDLGEQGESKEKEDGAEFATGSPFPGMKQLGEPVRIPKATVDTLKDQVFGFDTFFVTGQEPYEGGILFKGNLRGTAAKSYQKITKRMQDKFGDEYRLFLLINPEDDKPVAVVVPRKTIEPESAVVPEWFAASAFGLVTAFTLLVRNVPALQSNILSTFDNLNLLKDGLPGTLVTLLVLGVHEAAHFYVARDIGVKLGIPYFVPSWQIGSFGSITRILSIVPSREDLLKFAVAGPLAGYALGFLLLLLGFILPPIDGTGIVVDPAVFHESFLPGAIAKLLLGDVLREGTPISINPLVLWAWAGLLINAINSIPTGEVDGGRISFSLWGRKASARIGAVTLGLLGISSLFNDVAFYWVVLIFFLQRGPISPLSDEITEPDSKYVALGVAVLLLGLVICLPYPFPFHTDAMNIDF